MENKNYSSRLIVLLITSLLITIAYLIFNSDSRLKEATQKIEETRKELKSAKDSLDISTKKVYEIMTKLHSTETNLTLIRSQVQRMDLNYKLSKTNSLAEIKELKEKIEAEDREQERLIKDLKKLK